MVVYLPSYAFLSLCSHRWWTIHTPRPSLFRAGSGGLSTNFPIEPVLNRPVSMPIDGPGSKSSPRLRLRESSGTVSRDRVVHATEIKSHHARVSDLENSRYCTMMQRVSDPDPWTGLLQFSSVFSKALTRRFGRGIRISYGADSRIIIYTYIFNLNTIYGSH
jgi:hypothetical protein